MNYKNLTRIVGSLGEILVRNDVTSIRIIRESIELTVNREKGGFRAEMIQTPSVPPEHKAVSKIKKKADETKALKRVVSPRVGIFHLCDPKTNEPFLVVGDEIKQNQKVGFIEALGQKFTVTNEYSGTVRRILIEDKMAVEYGQPLFELEE